MKIVSIEEIPEIATECPLDILTIFGTATAMQKICESAGGIGLAATQVGIPWKLFIVKEKDYFRHFVNCSYVPLDTSTYESAEGCLSITDTNGIRPIFVVNRYKKIRVTGKELVNLKFEDVDFIRINDAVFQHEIDHGWRDRLINKIGVPYNEPS